MPSPFTTEILPILTSDRLYRLALSYTRNAAWAEDLVQDVATRAWAYRESYAPGTNAWAWVATITRRVAADQGTKNRLRASEPLTEDSETLLRGWSGTSTADDIDERLDDRRKLDAALERIEQASPLYHEAVVRRLRGEPIETVARELGISPATVSTRVHRGVRLAHAATA